MGTVRYNVINGQVLSETRSGVKRDYLTDGLGNTLALLDNTQTKTDTFDYFPSGTVAARTGTNPTPFQWNGGSGYFTDSSTRKYVRARNYFNSTGRWGSQDPTGFKAGDFNLYRYVGNRFVTAKDLSGLACKAKNISVYLEGPTCKDYGSLGTCYFDLSAHFTLRFTVPKGGDANDCWIHQYQRELYENDPFYYPDDTDEKGVHHWPWVTSQAIGKRSWEYPKTFVAEDHPGVHVGRTINPTCNANWDYE